MGLDIIGNTFNNGGATSGGDNAMFFDQISQSAHYYLPGYSGSQNGELPASPAAAGTASANLTTFMTDATHSNSLTNGSSPGFSAGKVNAKIVVGVLGTIFSLPVPL